MGKRYFHLGKMQVKKKGKTTVRISRSTLPSGNELALVTDLPDTVTTEELADLYYQRWEIEKKYNTLKNKMKFEGVTAQGTFDVIKAYLQKIKRYAKQMDENCQFYFGVIY